ncbi:MAG: YraN family protein [Phycisphaerales bacterium]|nr:MAG: YraN family protein [Phycisphaerales bacterium]
MRRLFGLREPSLGRRGERAAARCLRKKGYRILERNYRLGDDEADIVALDPDGITVALVEVKTRREPSPAPEESIDRNKQFRMARLASRLMKQRRMAGRSVRFDAVTIVWPEGGEPAIRHYAGAFESPI